MSAHQIKSNITNIVNHIEDENELKACFDALRIIVKGNKRQPTTVIKANKPQIEKKNTATPSSIRVKIKLKKSIESHDLSLAFLANELFKGNESLSEAGEIAFEKAFKKSLKKEPSLPNRL